ncbi:MAG: hypothetical protein JWR23_578 [Mucilaginibacter sp.]|nr:hypothetical protein [Mucilaginibacter sp.]
MNCETASFIFFPNLHLLHEIAKCVVYEGIMRDACDASLCKKTDRRDALHTSPNFNIN